jgi:hypothetical protein
VAIGAERRGLLRAAEADQGYGGAGLLEPLSVVTQLRDVHATERSPEVAQERQDHRPLAPERRKRHVPATAVEHMRVRCVLPYLDRS